MLPRSYATIQLLLRNNLLFNICIFVAWRRSTLQRNDTEELDTTRISVLQNNENYVMFAWFWGLAEAKGFYKKDSRKENEIAFII